ncbi:hypothetical protein AG1IA_02448 [Rhizoctonia solani AG-1 IA]|uniref:Uncharacterized protein n=1 Tax=Thanatephorus cucumeris (strain AG1-IA) TaxID=983506 RepID=L8X343_THACA|nr:hypothetical protein AG1IA_02448 [Rhizoctonia solani AG-1 IA]
MSKEPKGGKRDLSTLDIRTDPACVFQFIFKGQSVHCRVPTSAPSRRRPSALRQRYAEASMGQGRMSRIGLR